MTRYLRLNKSVIKLGQLACQILIKLALLHFNDQIIDQVDIVPARFHLACPDGW